jgi:predicted nucleotidyltransferase
MEIEALIADIVQHVRPVAGVEAMVLGGSRARGTHQPSSDVDLCFYYEPGRPLDLDHLGRLAAELDDEHGPDVLTGIGGWGPWINGGGWLTVGSWPVDFLYRGLGRVRAVIAACQAGQVKVAYQPGHPHAFVSSIYVGQVALCRPLWDPRRTVGALQDQTRPYPAGLKRAVIQRFAWEIKFALQTGHESVAHGDVAYAAGFCFRSIACLLQSLFALNKEYWLNEKGAVDLADTFPLRPPQLRGRVEAAFAGLASATQSIERALAELEAVEHDTHALLT